MVPAEAYRKPFCSHYKKAAFDSILEHNSHSYGNICREPRRCVLRLKEKPVNLHDWLDIFRESIESSLSLIVAFLPKLLGTLTLLLAGYLLARMVGAGKTALLKLLGINRLLAMTHSRAS
jgi:ABC-type maltose transport system permease subunit